MLNRIIFLLLGFLIWGCSSKFLQYEKIDQLKHIDEFEQQVKIVESTPPKVEGAEVTPTAETATTVKTPIVKPQKVSKKAAKSKKPSPQIPLKKEPDLEDDEGFNIRRPIKDPFRVGEEVTHKVFYDAALFDLPAGSMTLKVDPFVEVNNRKSYKFVIDVKSSSWFSSYYSVEDEAVTLMDFDLMIPPVFSLHVKESGQLREARSFFDFEKNKSTYWEKKVTKKSGVEEKKVEWEILPYSQNVFSAVFYLRTFQWSVGKEHSFRVADDQENLIFKAVALEREVLKTDLGPMAAIKIKPEVILKGVFKPVGDIYIWLSDDDRKYILKLESKIKIGTIVSEVTSIRPGTE